MGLSLRGFGAAPAVKPDAAWRSRILRNLARFGSGVRGHGVQLRGVWIERYQGRDDITAAFGAPTGLSQHNLLIHMESYELEIIAARALGVPAQQVKIDEVLRGPETRSNDSIEWTVTAMDQPMARGSR